MKSLKIGLISTLISLGFVSTAFAKPDITIVMDTKRVIMKDGKEVFDNKPAQPGNVLLYTLKVTNKGDSAAIEVEPIGPIPDNTSYVAEQNNTKYKRTFSIDDSSFQEIPKITVKEKGKSITKDAPPEMYKKIKWFINKINPKETYTLTYKVRVK